MPEIFPKGSKDRKLFEWLCNLALAYIYARFALKFFEDFQENQKISSALLVVQETVLIFMFLTRKQSVDFSVSPIDWICGILGTYAIMLVQPTGNESAIATGIQMLTMVWSIVGYFSLGRSISIVPAHRELKEGGLYRIVRHPLYAGYLVSFICILANNLSVYNAVIVCVAVLTTIARVLREEKFLLSSNPDYAAYTQQTKYRLFPYVF
jgi:protein-S-isoprenylcysteine O-methyltransferase Ste14